MIVSNLHRWKFHGKLAIKLQNIRLVVRVLIAF